MLLITLLALVTGGLIDKIVTLFLVTVVLVIAAWGVQHFSPDALLTKFLMLVLLVIFVLALLDVFGIYSIR